MKCETMASGTRQRLEYNLFVCVTTFQQALQGHEAKLRESLRERDSENAALQVQVAALETSVAETEQQKRTALAALDRSAKEMGDALAVARKEHDDALEVRARFKISSNFGLG